MRSSKLKWRRILGEVLVLFTLSLGSHWLHAQQYFGTIVGTVTDPSGGALPDATVTVTNTQTAISRQVKTDQLGNYRVESLVPSTYTIKVEHSGFETAEVQATDLPVAQTVTVSVVMKLGAITQTVEVQASAPLLDTADSTVGTVVNNKSVINMPLNGRAYTDLLLLVPGSVPNGSIFLTAGGGQKDPHQHFEDVGDIVFHVVNLHGVEGHRPRAVGAAAGVLLLPFQTSAASPAGPPQKCRTSAALRLQRYADLGRYPRWRTGHGR